MPRQRRPSRLPGRNVGDGTNRLSLPTPPRLSAEHLEALRSLFEWSNSHADNVRFGTGADIGSFNAEFAAISQRSVFTARSDGSLTLSSKWLTEPESAKAWSEHFGLALQRDGFSLPVGFTERWVNLPETEWVPRVSDFIRILSDEIENATGAAEQIGPKSE